MLGQMFPFATLTYYDPNTHTESANYTLGYTAIYAKTIKYPENGNGPLRLVYSSPSINRNDSGIFSGVLLYQVNPDYMQQANSVPQANNLPQTKPEVKPTSSSNATGDTVTIDTKFGQITSSGLFHLFCLLHEKFITPFGKYVLNRHLPRINIPTNKEIYCLQ